MAKHIALFNHKGGVSKTTTTFNLGWKLASKGKRVIIVDADPQCNLSGLVLGYTGPTEFESFYESNVDRNILAGLAPAFESRPSLILPVECVEVGEREGLYLLPGHIRLSEYEVTLGIAQELSGSIQTLQNLPGSIAYLLDETAKRYNAEYVLIDMNPSLSSINQNLLMTSHYFMVPTTPDYFSVMAVDSLTTVLPRWHDWATRASSMPILKGAAYPFPSRVPKFIGTIIQNYRPRRDKPAAGFQKWIDEINNNIKGDFSNELRKIDMMLPEDVYEREGISSTYCLTTIPDFNSLITISQDRQTPVYALTPEQIRQGGIVLERTIRSRDSFDGIFDDLADKVIRMTQDADGD